MTSKLFVIESICHFLISRNLPCPNPHHMVRLPSAIVVSTEKERKHLIGNLPKYKFLQPQNIMSNVCCSILVHIWCLQMLCISFPLCIEDWSTKPEEASGFSLTIYTFSMTLLVSLLFSFSFPAPFTCVIEILINSNFYPTFIRIVCFQLFCAPPAVYTSQKRNGKRKATSMTKPLTSIQSKASPVEKSLWQK